MKHPSNRELFDYWNARRGSARAPERGEIDPHAIRRVLADTFILSFEPDRGHPFRLAGTRVCALFARELKDQSFLDLWSGESRRELRDLVGVVATEAVGAVAAAVPAASGDAALALELVLLPLSHHGRTDARLLGALAAHEPARWLGMSIARTLVLGSHRFLGERAGFKRLLAPLPLHQRAARHGFIVHDGGQS
jgi:hypothetical protein